MAQFDLSDLPYKFIPASTVSNNTAVNAVIEELTLNAMLGRTSLRSEVIYPKIINLNPFVEELPILPNIELVDNTLKEHDEHILKRIKRDTFCIEQKLENYLTKTAECFMVIGKSPIQTYIIAEDLAKSLNKEHIDVMQIISKEITKNTKLGNFLHANLVSGKCIPVDLALDLLMDEVRKKKYLKNGYVLSGFPIIPGEELHSGLIPYNYNDVPPVPPYVFQTVSITRRDDDDESTDYEGEEEQEPLKKKYEEVHEGEQEETSSVSATSIYNVHQDEKRLSFMKDKIYFLDDNEDAVTVNLQKQLNIIMNLHIMPNIIVYVSSENVDILSKFPLITEKKYKLMRRHLIRFDQHFEVIQHFLLKYPKEQVIKIDGRHQLTRIMSDIQNRIKYLSATPVVHPTMIFKDNVPPNIRTLEEDANDLYGALQLICEKNALEPYFNWLKTDCNIYCPVELHRGKRIRGVVKFAVRFLGYVFLLSSKLNAKRFIEEPTKYFFNRPTCRVAIVGPQSTGKTFIAKMLKFLLKGEIYSINEAIYKLTAYQDGDLFIEKKMEQILADAADIAKLKYEHYEDLRLQKMDEWRRNVLVILENRINCVGDFPSKDAYSNIISTFYEGNSKFLRSLMPDNIAEPSQFVNPRYGHPLVEHLWERNIYDARCKHYVQEKKFIKDFIAFIMNLNEDINNYSYDDEDDDDDYDDYKLYERWIIDDAPLNLKFWKELSDFNFLPDIVIFLNPSDITEEYFKCDRRTLKQNAVFIAEEMCKTFVHWYKHDNFDKNELLSYFSEYIRNELTISYGKFIVNQNYDQYQKDIEKLENFLILKNITCININENFTNRKDVALNVIKKYLYLFKCHPRTLTYDELVKMIPVKVDESSDYEEEEEGEEEDVDASEEQLIKYLRFGSLLNYCPVMYRKFNILIRGDPKYCVEYQNLLYFLSSDECYDEFMRDPEIYAHLHEKPEVPPYKICVIGPSYLEKIALSMLLTDEFHIKRISYQTLLLDDTKTVDENEEDLQKALTAIRGLRLDSDLLQKLKNMVSTGAVICSFPQTYKQFYDMIENGITPEAVFIIFNYETAFKELYSNELYFWYSNKEGTDNENNNNDNKMKLKNRNISKMLAPGTKKRIIADCKEILEQYISDMDEMENLCRQMRIPILKVSKNFSKFEIKQFRKRLDNNVERLALFDKVYQTTMEKAEIFLQCGMFRLSGFKYSCPVDIYNEIPVNHYQGSKLRHKLYPCIYHDLIYYINGKENLSKFLVNPYKYLQSGHTFQYHEPLRICVVGPDRSGVTSLCKRIAKQFGMVVLNEDYFINYIINDLRWANIYEEFLGNDCKLNKNILAQCLHLHQNLSPNGIVVDNYKVTTSILDHLLENIVDFHVVFILRPSMQKLWQIYSNNIKTYTYAPKYIYECYCAYEKFEKYISTLEESRKDSLYNIIYLEQLNCKWNLWNQVYSHINTITWNMIRYIFNLTSQHSARVVHLNICQTELYNRLDRSEFYCPICLMERKLIKYRYDFQFFTADFFRKQCQDLLQRPYGYFDKNIYENYKFQQSFTINPNIPPITGKHGFRTNMLQYRNRFYWACDDHLIELLLNTSSYLPIEMLFVPQYVPLLLMNSIKILEQHDGHCVVCYAKNLPKFVRIKGDPTLPVFYRGKIYLSCTKDHVLEFCTYPEKYRKQKMELVREDEEDLDLKFMTIDYKNLTQDLLTAALVELVKIRPKHLNLRIEDSASIYLGLYLKLYSLFDIPTKKALYQDIFERFLYECNIIPDLLNEFKTNRNPYILTSIKTSEISTQRMPSVEHNMKNFSKLSDHQKEVLFES